MNIIPAFALAVVIAHLDSFLQWFSDLTYTELLKRAPHHLLVKLRGYVDLTRIEQACAAFHHATGPGAKPTYHVAQLVRALLVQTVYGWSLREWEHHLRYDLLVKWFVGYPVFALGPDHTTLARFTQWVEEYQHRCFFDEMLCQIDARFPDERPGAQIGDTFAMEANAAKESLVRLVRHACQRLLTTLEQVGAERVEHVRSQLDLRELFGPEHELGEYRLTVEQRAARLSSIVVNALDCLRLVRAELEAVPPLTPEARAPVVTWLDLLDKILDDDIQLTRDESGQVIAAAERTHKGSYRLGSATDPQATYRTHDKQSDLGYNVSVAVSDHFVREIQANTGAQPDGVGVAPLIAAQQEHHDLTPSKLIYDAAAGTGKVHAQVREVSGGHTQLVAPLVNGEKADGRLGPSSFTLSEDGQALTCPHGQTSTTVYRRTHREGRTFRFSARQCRGCPLWDVCRSQKPDSKAQREVFISDYRADYEAARLYSLTPEFYADRKSRSRVERFIAGLVRYNGARRARRRGLRNADFQAKMAAVSFNLKRWVRLLDPPAPPAIA